MLDGLVGCFKIGLELFVAEGPAALRAVEAHSGAGIFLDLKLHDIPATMRGALRSAAGYRTRFITAHCDQGERLTDAGAKKKSGEPEILAITALTSLGEKHLPPLGYREGLTISQLVLNRAEIAKQAGCAGVVCSGREAAAVKRLCGADFKVVTPGIRIDWSAVQGDDQERTVTPGGAIAAGADFIVVGRPIRMAKNPQDAAKRIAEEIGVALHTKPANSGRS